MGLTRFNVLTGDELRGLSDTALMHRVGEVNVFAETEPNQKERILGALRKAGHVVGYLGDGIKGANRQVVDVVRTWEMEVAEEHACGHAVGDDRLSQHLSPA